MAMWAPPVFQALSDGRAHFSHGPIDLVTGVEGDPARAAAAIDRAWGRFAQILEELVDELPRLRAPGKAGTVFASPVAARMQQAIEPFVPEIFATPMAAVAGAVADEIRDALVAEGGLDKVHVNNGGDIALHLEGRKTLRVGLAPDLAVENGRVALQGHVTLGADDGIGGIATSGRHGRSLSLGIADAVTVLAKNAARADAAATLIANAVDVDSPKIDRAEAQELDPDSDLGGRLVTVDVGELTAQERRIALDQGEKAARAYVSAGAIRAAAVHLDGDVRLVGVADGQIAQLEEPAWT